MFHAFLARSLVPLLRRKVRVDPLAVEICPGGPVETFQGVAEGGELPVVESFKPAGGDEPGDQVAGGEVELEAAPPRSASPSATRWTTIRLVWADTVRTANGGVSQAADCRSVAISSRST